jgi:hypothetical protein
VSLAFEEGQERLADLAPGAGRHADSSRKSAELIKKPWPGDHSKATRSSAFEADGRFEADGGVRLFDFARLRLAARSGQRPLLA